MSEINNEDIEKDDKKNQGVSIGRAFSLLYQIAFTVIFSLLLFYFIGKKSDEWFHTSGIFTIIGIVFGMICGVYLVYKEVAKI